MNVTSSSNLETFYHEKKQETGHKGGDDFSK